MPELDTCKILMVVPPARFKDEELDITRRCLERRKATIEIASIAQREVFGMAGARVRPAHQLDSVSVQGFAAVVFVGGMGTRDLWDSPAAHRVAREAVEAGLLVAAISTAPVILARAGLLEGKEATVYFSETKQLTERGATYTGAPMSVAGNILTCKSTEAVEKMALHLVKLLLERTTG